MKMFAPRNWLTLGAVMVLAQCSALAPRAAHVTIPFRLTKSNGIVVRAMLDGRHGVDLTFVTILREKVGLPASYEYLHACLL